MDGLACCLFFCSFSLLSTLRSWWAVEKELFLDVSFSISCSIPSALYPTYYNNKNVCAWVTVMAKKIQTLYLWPSSDFLRCSSNEMKTVHTGPGILIIDNAATHCPISITPKVLDIKPSLIPIMTEFTFCYHKISNIDLSASWLTIHSLTQIFWFSLIFLTALVY